MHPLPSPPPPRARRPLRWLTWLAPASMLLSLGCAKMDGATHTASMEMQDYPGEMAPAPMVEISMQSGARLDQEYDFSADLADDALIPTSEMAAPPARSRPGAPSTRGPEERAAEANLNSEEGDDPPTHGRQIIYIAGLQISVYDLENAMAMVESVPDRLGGWIHMRSENQVVLRLPALKLKQVMAELAEIGVVEGRTLQAQDVTAEYVDLESRIIVLRETQTQLLELLGTAKTVEEALHVRRALDDVTMDLELALGRMRQISDLIAFSTLTITLVERGPQDHIPTSNDPFGWVDELGVEATEWR